MAKKTLTLRQYVKKNGTQEHCAFLIGVTTATLNRWLKGHKSPSNLAREKLALLGIKEVG